MKLALPILFLIILLLALSLGGAWLERNLPWVASRVQKARERLLATAAIRKLRAHYPRVTKFFAARFARGEYLGLHLTIGFGVILAGLVVFSIITRNVVTQAPITRFDNDVLRWLRGQATILGYAGWGALTTLGNGFTLAVIGAGVSLLLTIRRRWIVLAGWAAALIGSGLLNAALKLAIRRPRPETAIDFISDMSLSFPSGHAMASLVTYGMLTYLLMLALQGRRWLQITIATAAALVILSIGFSRMYLGVHYFSDVVGGFSVGALWLSACVSGLEVARRLKGRTPVAP